MHNPLVDYPGVHYSIIAITAIIVIFLWGSSTLAHFKYKGRYSDVKNSGKLIKQ